MQKRILVGVLDWGLGHASRMVPVIDELAAHKAEVILASSGTALVYLRNRYPHLRALEVPAPQIRYSRQGAGPALVRQALSQKRWNERQCLWMAAQQRAQAFDAVISDNLYGLHHPDIPSALVSHQMQVPAPAFGKMINRELARWLSPFDELWAPDSPDGLAGRLTQNPFCDKPVHYLGTLSRLHAVDHIASQYTCAALISGPEPQRSIFEKHCLAYLARLEGPTALIQGLAGQADSPPHTEGRTLVFPFLDDEALGHTLQSAGYVLCRSGYSTLCDLTQLSCKATLAPTPGQPEQVFLAKRAAEKGWFLSARPNGISSVNPADLEATSPPPPATAQPLTTTVGRFLKA